MKGGGLPPSVPPIPVEAVEKKMGKKKVTWADWTLAETPPSTSSTESQNGSTTRPLPPPDMDLLPQSTVPAPIGPPPKQSYTKLGVTHGKTTKLAVVQKQAAPTKWLTNIVPVMPRAL